MGNHFMIWENLRTTLVVRSIQSPVDVNRSKTFHVVEEGGKFTGHDFQ